MNVRPTTKSSPLGFDIIYNTLFIDFDDNFFIPMFEMGKSKVLKRNTSRILKTFKDFNFKGHNKLSSKHIYEPITANMDNFRTMNEKTVLHSERIEKLYTRHLNRLETIESLLTKETYAFFVYLDPKTKTKRFDSIISTDYLKYYFHQLSDDNINFNIILTKRANL